MSKLRFLASLLLAGSLLVLGTAPALADRDDDREAIHALMWRYTRALDSFNPEAYAAVYTEDGEFKSGNNSTRGKQALMDMIKGLKQGREQRAAAGEAVSPMYHMTTDSWIEFIDGTHARHHSYFLTVFGAAGAGSAPTVAAAGRGVDELVKVRGEWLIKIRDVAPQD